MVIEERKQATYLLQHWHILEENQRQQLGICLQMNVNCVTLPAGIPPASDQTEVTLHQSNYILI